MTRVTGSIFDKSYGIVTRVTVFVTRVTVFVRRVAGIICNKSDVYVAKVTENMCNTTNSDCYIEEHSISLAI